MLNSQQKNYKRSFVTAEMKYKRYIYEVVTPDDIKRIFAQLLIDARIHHDPAVRHAACKIVLPYVLGLPVRGPAETHIEDTQSTAPRFDFSRVNPDELRTAIDTMKAAMVMEDESAV